MVSPYRTAVVDDPSSGATQRVRDVEVTVVLGVLWLASAVRVALAFAGPEMFEAEATLALLATVLIPFVVRAALACA
jgi:hypothetical protein